MPMHCRVRRTASCALPPACRHKPRRMPGDRGPAPCPHGRGGARAAGRLSLRARPPATCGWGCACAQLPRGARLRAFAGPATCRAQGLLQPLQAIYHTMNFVWDEMARCVAVNSRCGADHGRKIGRGGVARRHTALPRIRAGACRSCLRVAQPWTRTTWTARAAVAESLAVRQDIHDACRLPRGSGRRLARLRLAHVAGRRQRSSYTLRRAGLLEQHHAGGIPT